jgi:hypothetical protein
LGFGFFWGDDYGGGYFVLVFEANQGELRFDVALYVFRFGLGNLVVGWDAELELLAVEVDCFG